MSLGTDLRNAFEQTHVQHHLSVVDPSYATIRSEHTYCLRALVRTRFFERAFTWSGEGIEKDPVVTSGRDDVGHRHHRLHGPVISRGLDRMYLIDLGRTMEPGQEEIVSIEQTFIDVSGTFQTHLSHKAQPGCQEIELRVTVPAGTLTEPQFIRRYAEAEDALQRSRLKVERDLNGRDTVTQVVAAPETGHVYRISWLKPS